MRVHIEIDDELVREIDRIAGSRDVASTTGSPNDFPMLDVEHWPVGE